MYYMGYPLTITDGFRKSEHKVVPSLDKYDGSKILVMTLNLIKTMDTFTFQNLEQTGSSRYLFFVFISKSESRSPALTYDAGSGKSPLAHVGRTPEMAARIPLNHLSRFC